MSQIVVTRGDTEVITIEMSDENGAIPFVTGDTVYFTIKIDANTATKVLQKTVTTFTNGKAVITLLPADTSSLAYGFYVYDIQFNRADGNVKTIVKPSTFKLAEEVTYD